MELSKELKIGLFNDDDQIDMSVKKQIFNQICEFILEYEQLCKQRYKKYLKVFNKFS